ncbi:MAG: hypothetical protein KDB22_19750, partial [Planctomycetales bacterium]|nr:hypothetical protein [Planctomycetales bacterium]
MTTTSFSNDNSRDAWFVVRGYKYQIDHTILRWLSLEEGQYLALECGEDVDIVNDLMAKQSTGIHRELEQIKYRESALTLRSVASREALANAVMHRLNNPSINLLFRFCTNTDVSSERPPIFDDRRAGINVWEQIRTGRRRGRSAERDLASILRFLRNVGKPKKVSSESWQHFEKSLSSISALDNLIQGFEWSYSQPDSADISETLKSVLISSFNVSKPEIAYAWVFMGVIECLSHRSQKRLTKENLLERLSQVAERSYEQHEVRFVTEIVRELAKRVDRLEYTVQRHEYELSVVKKSLLQ